MKRILLTVLGVFALAISTAQGANVYWVSFHSDDNTPSANALAAGFVQAPDAGYTQLLRNAGHNVTRVVTSGSPNTALLNAADLVIISRSVPSGDYQDDPETAAWNGITAPTMVLGGYVVRNSRLGYTTGGTIPDTTSPAITLSVTDASHPIFDGIPVGTNGVMSTPFATSLSFDGVLQRGISVNTDPVSGNGQVLATVGNAGDPAFGGMVIGEWDAGATLATGDVLGGHRMVFLTGSREQTITSEGAGIFDLTADGSRLFLNAVNYMAVPEPSTMALLVIGGASMLFLRRRKA
ncbi:MAG: PEP-CTERM sorting domain-containing protein [Verrucomicrobiia bacterium]